MRIKGKNTFTTLLSLLGVRYSESFSDKYFNEHPHKLNLYGLSKMLSDYGIRNAATRIEDKENDIVNIECPFVAFAGGEFVAVFKIDADRVYYIRDGKKMSIPIVSFIQSWSGVVLLAETTPDSIEPDYKEHHNKDLLLIAQRSILAFAVILILGIACIQNVFLAPSFFPFALSRVRAFVPVTASPVVVLTLLLLVNLIGVYICYMLVLKQLHVNSRYVDKICTLFSQSDCNNVLESDAAKLFGLFGWSEIGLGYFTANIIILLLLPHLLPWLVVINILALPYSFWSVWYQKVKARQWCPLCLIVQVLLWTIFLLNLTFGLIDATLFSFHSPLFIVHYSLFTVFCVYVIPVFALNLILPKMSEGNQVVQLNQEINSIKANEDVFRTLLTQQPFYEVSKADSQILFGNPDAKLQISILTNPFCNPCAKMHARVAKLLGKGEPACSPNSTTNLCIQYIFSAFDESLEYANRYFNAIYLQKGKEAVWQLYSDWFEKGKALQEAFFHDLQLDMSNPAIEAEFQKHQSWKEKTKLRATPTIIVNGYKLPENYKIEDVQYFTEFDVNIK